MQTLPETKKGAFSHVDAGENLLVLLLSPILKGPEKAKRAATVMKRLRLLRSLV
jgi:hypothetical protein